MSLIHPSAVIDRRAQIGANCQIGPYCVIGGDVVLGDDCTLHSHVVVDGHTVLGKGNEIYPFATIGVKGQDLKWKGGITRTVIGDQNTFREHVSVHSATGEGEVTTVGSHNYLLAYCHLAHNVTLGSHVIMSNSATLGGHVTVEDRVVIGGLTAVHQFCRIGEYVMIGGCSKVVQDLAPYMLVDGSPAKPRTINKIGLERNGIAEGTRTALKHAYKILFRDGLTLSNAVERIGTELPASPEIKHLTEFILASERGISR